MAQLILWASYDAPHTLKRAIGSYQLASWLRLHGYTVAVVDFCHALKTCDLVDLTLQHVDKSTIAIGVSNTFWSHKSFFYKKGDGEHFEPDWVIKARDVIQTLNSKIDWLLGGPYTANIPPNSTKFDWRLFYGFAEDNILKYMDDMSGKKRTHISFDVKNIIGPFNTEDCIQPFEVLPIEMSRGCQFRCTFCRFPLLGKEKNSYLRNSSSIEDELLRNYDNFGVTRYSFMDDTFNESIEKVENIANISKRLPFTMEWVGFLRLDLIGSNRPTIQLLKDSGMKSCHFGVETFHRESAKMIGKGWNGVHGKEFLLELKDIYKDNVNFFMSFIVGLGNEPVDNINTTHQWCKDNDMAGWTFYPLGIKPDATGEWKSVFDGKYADYGYTFTNPIKKDVWTNGTWTSITAKEKADSLMTECQLYEKPSGFLLGELGTLGYKFDEIMNVYKKSISSRDIVKKRSAFLQRYIQMKRSVNV